MSLISSVSSIPRPLPDGDAAAQPRGGEAELARPIKDPEVRAAFIAAYRGWAAKEEAHNTNPRSGTVADQQSENRETYRLFVNDSRTVFVRFWDNGTVEVARRLSSAHLWGPPVQLTEEVIA